jgi:quinoprotein glucose dehydrogenase
MRYVRGQASNPQNAKAPPVTLTVQGLPLVKPPYGRITAIDLKTGTMAWQVAPRRDAGQHPQPPGAKGVTDSAHGPAGRIGTLVTKTLLIAGEGGR